VTCFAAWFGTVLASLFLLRTLETRLTGTAKHADENAIMLREFIKLETKAADVAFIGVVFSGILLAWLFHGWTIWLGVKTGVIVLQVVLTMGYIVRSIRPLSYPCSPEAYRNWYRLFAISLTMFALVLLITFFLL
jgi:putative membrane protein